MPVRLLIILLISCFTPFACQSQLPERGTIHERIPVTTDTTLSFALYIPTKLTNLTDAGAILFFDPHGNGRFPLDLYRSLADRYGIVLIGNNHSRNGLSLDLIFTNTQRLIDDIQQRYGLPMQQLALWGFSGGAKAAMYTGSQLLNTGPVLYGGAFLPVELRQKQLGFAGTSDMNYADLVGYGLSQQHNPDHLQLEFDGPHAWPDTATADFAFAWLHTRFYPEDTAFKKSYVADIQIAYQESLKAKHNVLALNLLDRCRFISDDPAEQTAWSKSRDSLLQTPGYNQEMAQRMSIQQQEQQLKSYYSQQFFSQPMSWWKTEIDHLNASGNPMNKRIVAFFSLAAYSLSNKALQLHDDRSATQILGIYQLSDPSNPEQAFLRAILYARQNDKVASQAALDEAKQLGFTDTNRILNDPDLQKLNIR